VNGGFETGDFTGWTVTGGPCEFVLGNIGGQSTCTGVDPGTDPGARSGSFAAYLGQAGSLGSISQTLATTAGTTYDLLFGLANTSNASLGGTDPNQFQVMWNGASVFNQYNLPASGYQMYDLSVVASGASTTLEFDAQQNPAWFVLDDVSVTPTPTPEPPMLALFGLGLGLAVVSAYRGRVAARAV
jgi:hypothetical protein